MKDLIFFGISCVFLTLLSCNREVKKVRGGEITIQKYNTLAHIVEKDIISLTHQDSLMYGEIASDFGNYWETTTTDNINRKVLFDFSNGKILIYINNSVDFIENDEPAQHVFSWDLDTINPYKIKGVFGYTDRDTTIYWTYDAKTESMINEKGLVYKRKNLNR
jgi:hypothetical protein